MTPICGAWPRRRRGASKPTSTDHKLSGPGGQTRGSPNGPLKTIDDVEWATMGWVDWCNNRRLHGELGYIPPEEFELNYYSQSVAPQAEMSLS